MSVLVPITGAAIESAVTGTAATLTSSIVVGQPGQYLYEFSANVACWLAQGGAGTTASAGAGSMWIPAGQVVTIDSVNGSHVSVISDGTSGKCSLAPAMVPR